MAGNKNPLIETKTTPENLTSHLQLIPLEQKHLPLKIKGIAIASIQIFHQNLKPLPKKKKKLSKLTGEKKTVNQIQTLAFWREGANDGDVLALAALQESARVTSAAILKKSSSASFPNLPSSRSRNLRTDLKKETSQGRTRPPLHSNPNSSAAFSRRATNTGRFTNRAGITNRRRSDPTYTARNPDGARRGRGGEREETSSDSEVEERTAGFRRSDVSFQRIMACLSRTIWRIFSTFFSAVAICTKESSECVLRVWTK